MSAASRYIDELFIKNQPTPPTKSIDIPSQQGWLKIDTRDRDKSQFAPANNFTINKSQNQYQSTGISKVAVGYVDFPWFIPNVNPRNNEGKFYNNSGNLITFTMPEGYYNLEDFAVALETSLIATGYGTFTVSIGPVTQGKQLTINNAVFNFTPAFELSSGKYQSLWEVTGMYKDQYTYPADITNNYITNYNGFYTRYVDITSSTINQYEKLKNEGTHGPSNDLVVRIWAKADSEFLKDSEILTGGPYTRPHYVKSLTEPIKFIDWEPTRTFGDNFDFRVLDEYGQLCYMGANPTAYPDYGLSFRTQSDNA